MKKVVSQAGDTEHLHHLYVVKSNKLVRISKLKTLIVPALMKNQGYNGN